MAHFRTTYHHAQALAQDGRFQTLRAQKVGASIVSLIRVTVGDVPVYAVMIEYAKHLNRPTTYAWRLFRPTAEKWYTQAIS